MIPVCVFMNLSFLLAHTRRTRAIVCSRTYQILNHLGPREALVVHVRLTSICLTVADGFPAASFASYSLGQPGTLQPCKVV